MLSPVLPVAVQNTWASSLVQTLNNVDTTYLQVIDNAIINPTIPGLDSSSGSTGWSNYLFHIGTDLQAIDVILTEVSSTLMDSISNRVITSTFTVNTGAPPYLSFSANSLVMIGGYELSIAGQNMNIPTSTTTSYVIYASSTLSGSYTQSGTYNAVLISSAGAPLSNPPSSVVELGYASIVGGATTFSFTPVPNNRTFSWSASLAGISSTYNSSSVSSSGFYIPFSASSTLEVFSVITVSGIPQVFTNPSFIESQLVTSSLGYVTQIIGTRPALFPTGTVANYLVTATSTSGTVTSSTLVTSTVGLTGFICTGSGASAALVVPQSGTFIIKW